jgi:predicted DNA-binding transcriptional regulator AlpA
MIPRSIRGERITEMLTARELEVLVKIDVKTIYTYVHKGLIPYVRIQLNLRFIREEILDWINQQSYQPHSENRQRLRG